MLGSRQSPVRENRTKTRLAKGEVVFGTMSQLPQPAFAEIAGAAGLDFFVIDMEHAAIAGQDVAHMVRASQAVGATAMIRVRAAEEKTLLWVLDTGVEGLMVPLVEDARTARRIYELSHFPPDGERTVCPQSRAASNGAHRANLEPYLHEANEQLLLIALLETPNAVAQAAEIAAEPIDVFVIGRGDLAVKMGLAGQPSHPQVMEATKRALSSVIDRGKVGGVMAYGLDEALEWMSFGCRFVIYSEPELIVVNELSSAAAALRETAVTA